MIEKVAIQIKDHITKLLTEIDLLKGNTSKIFKIPKIS